MMKKDRKGQSLVNEEDEREEELNSIVKWCRAVDWWKWKWKHWQKPEEEVKREGKFWVSEKRRKRESVCSGVEVGMSIDYS